MSSEVDEGKGLVKCYWKDVREQVAKVEPRFAALVDEIDPGEKFPVYKAYYPYGMSIGNAQTGFIPKVDGGYYELDDPAAPADIKKHLGYGADSLPLGMVLEKQFEYYVNIPDQRISIPWRISHPGMIFPLARILNTKNRIYAPNAVLLGTSGARSVFMLPNIGCATQHSNLQRDFNVKSSPPKNLGEQWKVFKEIFDSQVIPSNWNCCILYFAESWVEHILHKQKWQNIKLYLYEDAWGKSEYHRNKVYYDIIFSIIQRDRNLKPNPYLADTAQHIITTALGDAPAYIPAINDEACPIDIIQQAYVESYGLKKYLPNIMQPAQYTFELDNNPIYYSLQYPSTYIFSPKSRQMSSTLYDLREVEHILDIFTKEVSHNEGLAFNTVLNSLSKILQFSYFHNKIDRHGIIQASTEIPKFDPRFLNIDPKYKIQGAKFAADGPFVRGCVGMMTKS